MTAPNVGILLPTRGLLTRSEPPRDLDEILGMAEAIEASGYDGAWVGDSLLASPRPEPIVTLAAVAGRTQRIKLGTSILISSLRHPLLLAHSVASLDLISKGRVILGIGFSSGRGLQIVEHASVGVPVEQRFARGAEGIEVMRALWSRREATHHGQHFDLEKVILEPKPAQPGGPPIWMHGMDSEVALRRVGKLGDGWINNLPEVERFRVSWEKIQENLAAGGRDPRGFTANLYATISIDANEAAARERGGAFIRSYYRLDPEVIEQSTCVRYGEPEACAEELARYVEAGCGTVIIRLAGENQLEQLDLCTERVLPVLKAATVAP